MQFKFLSQSAKPRRVLVMAKHQWWSKRSWRSLMCQKKIWCLAFLLSWLLAVLSQMNTDCLRGLTSLELAQTTGTSLISQQRQQEECFVIGDSRKNCRDECLAVCHWNKITNWIGTRNWSALHGRQPWKLLSMNSVPRLPPTKGKMQDLERRISYESPSIHGRPSLVSEETVVIGEYPKCFRFRV